MENMWQTNRKINYLNNDKTTSHNNFLGIQVITIKVKKKKNFSNSNLKRTQIEVIKMKHSANTPSNGYNNLRKCVVRY